MKESHILPELFKTPIKSFAEHLDITENYRILFSGTFGIGKTTFIEHYFKTENEKYNVIHLFPVNYSVLENEDIFKYIKYDIFIGLLSKYKKPEPEDNATFFSGVPYYIIENIMPLLATTVLLSGSSGRSKSLFIEKLIEWKNDYVNYSKSKKQKDDDKISEFLNEIHKHDGGLYDYGHVTNIIINWLQYLKNENQNMQNILVIDDLDRIDPHHIFRILNVFSAHFDTRDESESKNKFGFDKVILVADVENVKSIYRAQYGVDTDFNGYVDKFYSKDVYRFDNRENIISIVDNIVDKIQVGTTTHGEFQHMGDSYRFRYDLKLILESFVKQDLINLRSLFRFRNEKIDITTSTFLVAGRKFNITSSNLTILVCVLTKMIGSLPMLKDKLSRSNHITNYRQKHSNIEGLIGNCAFFAIADKLKFNSYGEIKAESNVTYEDTDGFQIKFDIESGPRGDFYRQEITSITNDFGRVEITEQKSNVLQNYDIAKILNDALQNITD